MNTAQFNPQQLDEDFDFIPHESKILISAIAAEEEARKLLGEIAKYGNPYDAIKVSDVWLSLNSVTHSAH